MENDLLRPGFGVGTGSSMGSRAGRQTPAVVSIKGLWMTFFTGPSCYLY